MNSVYKLMAFAAVLATAPGCIIGFGHPTGFGHCGGAVGCGDCCGSACMDGCYEDSMVVPESGPPGRFFPVPSQPVFSPGNRVVAPQPAATPAVEPPVERAEVIAPPPAGDAP